MQSPSVFHQLLIFSIGVPLREFVRRLSLGEVIPAPIDMILSATNVVQPDIIFISNARSHDPELDEFGVEKTPSHSYSKKSEWDELIAAGSREA